LDGKLYPYNADIVAYLTRILSPDEFRIPTNKGNVERGLLGMKNGVPVFFLMAVNEDVLKAMPVDIERARATNAQIYEIMKSEKDSALLAQKVRAILTQSGAGESVDGQEKASGSQTAIDGQIAMVTSPWFRFFVGYDPRPALRSVTCPVLVLHGEKDIQVGTVENQKEILKALGEGGNSRVRAAIMPGLNHLFQSAQTGSIGEYGTLEETFSPAALEAVGDWVAEVTR